VVALVGLGHDRSFPKYSGEVMVKKETKERVAAWFIFIFSVFMLGGLVTALKSGWGSSEAAGWMQAIGVIAAIVGTYVLGERQAKTAKKNADEFEERQKSEKLHSILAIMEACGNTIDELLDTYDNNPGGRLALALSYDERIYDGFVRAITTINLYDIKSAEGIAAVIGAQQSIARIQVDIRYFLSKSVSAGVKMYGGPAPENESLRIGQRKIAFHNQYNALITALQNLGNAAAR
jgi:hypothetical protein